MENESPLSEVPTNEDIQVLNIDPESTTPISIEPTKLKKLVDFVLRRKAEEAEPIVGPGQEVLELETDEPQLEETLVLEAGAEDNPADTKAEKEVEPEATAPGQPAPLPADISEPATSTDMDTREPEPTGANATPSEKAATRPLRSIPASANALDYKEQLVRFLGGKNKRWPKLDVVTPYHLAAIRRAISEAMSLSKDQLPDDFEVRMAIIVNDKNAKAPIRGGWEPNLRLIEGRGKLGPEE